MLSNILSLKCICWEFCDIRDKNAVNQFFGLRIEDWGPIFEEQGLRTEDWRPRIGDRGLRTEVGGQKIENRGLRTKDWGQHHTYWGTLADLLVLINSNGPRQLFASLPKVRNVLLVAMFIKTCFLMLKFINNSPWCIVTKPNNNQISAQPIKIVPSLIQPIHISVVAKKWKYFTFRKIFIPCFLILHQRSFSSSFWHISETCD